jgi:hypothetical protein
VPIVQPVISIDLENRTRKHACYQIPSHSHDSYFSHFDSSNLLDEYFSIFDQKKLMIQRVQKVCHWDTSLSSASQSFSLNFKGVLWWFRRWKNGTSRSERERLEFFITGKFFVLSQPKGILVKKLRFEKIVHIKATSLVLFNPLMVLLNVFPRSCFRYGLAAMMHKFPNQTREKSGDEGSFFSWKLRGSFCRAFCILVWSSLDYVGEIAVGLFTIESSFQGLFWLYSRVF